MPDELSLRRESFAPESEPVTFGDGSTWYLPKPTISLIPVMEGGKRTGLAARTHFGPEFDALVDAVGKTEDNADLIAAVFDVAIFLLGRNYAVPDALYAELLVYQPGDEASSDLLAAIMAVARGQGQKKSSGGESSP